MPGWKEAVSLFRCPAEERPPQLLSHPYWEGAVTQATPLPSHPLLCCSQPWHGQGVSGPGSQE